MASLKLKHLQKAGFVDLFHPIDIKNLIFYIYDIDKYKKYMYSIHRYKNLYFLYLLKGKIDV